MSTEPTPAMIGIDVGGTKSLAVAIDMDGAVLADRTDTTRATASALVDLLVEQIEGLREALGSEVAVRGVGVGIAGLVGLDGRLRRAPNLVDADEFPVQARLEPRVGVPVFVDNDANCAARAEMMVGAGVGVRDALVVTLGTGIGGAVVVDGEVRRGAAGMAGEPGHMMVDPNGPDCVCGLRGCWERYASGAGLAHLGRLAAADGRLATVLAAVGDDLERLRGEHITRAARSGDADAMAVLDIFAWWVAVGVANSAALLDPELVIVGGGLVREWDLYGDSVSRALGDLLLAADHRPPISVVPARAGVGAGALGAALLARAEVGGGSADRRGPGGAA